ncbi:hypothetical protein MKX03_006070 [Papaver bracteatum]|nr:hypothetical protein MKX03_006070 [Papaver bracteatum]
MAKIIVFVCFFLLVLIAMPASSSSRLLLEEDHEVTCPKKVICEVFTCAHPPDGCPEIKCSSGQYKPCCDCPICCRAP